ncbi:MAG: DUF805 domain-containing protein [Nitrospirae bacterium]|nr:DUF805 domain-containing protein [Nitrospirota bacterium]
MNHDTSAEKNNVMKAVWFLFSFKGRVSRKQFWFFYLVAFLGALILTSFTGISSNLYEFTRPQLMFMLWILWPSLAVQAKRWHDQDKTALWLLLNFVPFVGPIWSLVRNGFFPGTPGPNRFGPDPLEIQKKNTQ